MKRLKTPILACVVLVLAACCAWRICDVNALAIRYPTERYEMGEDAPLEGCFFADDTEGTDGYSLRIEEAEVMSYNEYVAAYGLDGAQAVDGLDAKSIICLTVCVTNNSDNGPEESGFNIVGMGMTKPNGDAFMRVDTELWALSEPALADNIYTVKVGVVPHSSYTTHIPFSAGFVLRDSVSGQGSVAVDDRYYQPVETGEYDLHLSVQPKRKLVNIEV